MYKFSSLYTAGYLAYLYDIEVPATQRRKGEGRLLMETLPGRLKEDGVNELWPGTATDNRALFSATRGVISGETFNDFTFEL